MKKDTQAGTPRRAMHVKSQGRVTLRGWSRVRSERAPEVTSRTAPK